MNISVRYQYNESDAKDVVNISYLKILENLSRYDKDKDFEAWASRICINTNIDQIRKNKKINKREVLYESLEEPLVSFNNVENDAIEHLNQEALLSKIRKLPTMMREVFVLYGIDGFSHKEIGDLLEISVEGSRYYLFEARKKLKKLIEQESIGSKMRSI